MNDSFCRRSRLLKRMNMRHHVVAEAFLPIRGPGKIDGVQRRLHLPERFGVDPLKAKFTLASGQLQP